jgi:SAM-dependent methyltransferase
MPRSSSSPSKQHPARALSLVCRGCHSTFTSTPDGETRCSCPRTLSIVDDVITVDSFNPVEGHRIRKVFLEAFFEDCQNVGWSRAFYQLLRNLEREGETTYTQTLGRKAAGWKWLLPMTADAQILCVGARVEAIPLALSTYGAEVFVVDRCHDRLRSTALAGKAVGASVTCLEVLRLDNLPFEDGSFDTIVIPDIQDVLRYFGSPAERSVSLELLQFLRRLLRENGVIYVAGDNRFTYAGTIASSNDATIATSGGRQRRARKSSTSSHSYRGYQLRLRESGFHPKEVYAPIPNHRSADESVPLSSDGHSTKNSRGEISRYLKDRIALHPQFLKAFGHSFALVASKNEQGGYSFIHEALLRLEWQLKLSNLSLEQMVFSNDETLVHCNSGKLALTVRIPLSASSARKTSLNAERLRKLASSVQSQYLQQRLPTWIYAWEQEGVSLSVETRLSGLPLETYVRHFGQRTFNDSVLRLLLSLSSVRGTGQQPIVPLLREMVDVSAPRILDPLVRSGFLDAAKRILDSVSELSLPGILVHGQLTTDNVLWNPDSGDISGLHSWHGSLERGLPGWDCVALESSFVAARYGCSFGEAIVWMLEQGVAPGFDDIWARYRESLQIKESERAQIVLSYWLVAIWQALSSEYSMLNYPWLRRNILSVVSRLSQSRD